MTRTKSTTFWAKAVLVSALISGITNAALGADKERPGRLFELGAKVSGIPAPVIYGIALNESGKRDGKTKRVEPHPWTLNSPAGSMYFSSREAAEIALVELLKIYRNVDIGWMQVNWHYNGRFYVEDPRELLDPRVNMIVAGLILKEAFIASNGDLNKTIARYHTWESGSRGKEYAKNVYSKVAQAYR